MTPNHYRHLGMMAALSFVATYLLMYAMVNTVDNAYMNIKQVYMAGLMTAPMVVIELIVMRAMYHDQKRNALIIAASVVAGILVFVLIRQQAAVSDQQFLRSMIPHHAGAILMCNRARLDDPEIRTLCKGIMSSQQAEIEQVIGKLRQFGLAITLSSKGVRARTVDRGPHIEQLECVMTLQTPLTGERTTSAPIAGKAAGSRCTARRTLR